MANKLKGKYIQMKSLHSFNANRRWITLSIHQRLFEKDITPSSADCFKWALQVQDCNYKSVKNIFIMIGVTNRRIIMQEIITLLCNCSFLQEVIFTYALAINVFRRWVRRNDFDAIICGRLKFSPLFLRSKQNQLSIDGDVRFSNASYCSRWRKSVFTQQRITYS